MITNSDFLPAEEHEENARLVAFVLDAFAGKQNPAASSDPAYIRAVHQLKHVFTKDASQAEVTTSLKDILELQSLSFWK